MAEEKDFRKENRLRMKRALAMLLGFISDPDDYPMLTAEQKRDVDEAFERRNLGAYTDNPERMRERDIQIQAAEKGLADKVELYRIVGVKDERTCKDCAQWQGQIVSMNPNTLGYPTVQDFINNHGFHVNCRCSLQELPVDEIPLQQEYNPRYPERAAARPDLYNAAPMVFNDGGFDLIFN